MVERMKPPIVDGYGNKTVGYPKINLDHVVEFRPFKNDFGMIAYKCYATNGAEIGAVAGYQLKTEPSGVVADSTGTILIGFWLDNDGVLTLCRYPVIAWSVLGTLAEPVI